MDKIPLTKKKTLSHFFVREFSPFLEKVNHNARFVNCAKANIDIPRFRTRDEVHEFVNRAYFKEGNQPLNYLEFGVFEGASVKLWSGINHHADSRFYGFDSFEGLPEAWRPGFNQGAFDVGGNLPDIKDQRVEFVKGWFQDSLPRFLEGFTPDLPLVVHNDSDLYSSTLYCLTALDCHNVMKPGTIVIFDEFGDPSHEFRALWDYASAYRREWKPIAATYNFWTTAIQLQ